MSAARFDGRVAVITGGGRGLGREYATLLAGLGAQVVVNDPGVAIRGEGEENADPAEEVVTMIRASGGQGVANRDSVATPEGAAAIIQTALDHFGRLDILIHNAGNVRYGSLLDLSQEDFRAVIDVHFMGAFHMVRAAFPVMAAATYGRIVLTSSIGGLYGNKACVNYAMAKSGMIGLSAVAALEGEAVGIRSNVIVPAAVTRMAEGLDISQYPPMGPELVAPGVAWLAHEHCAVSGEIFACVAGRIARMLIAETPGVYRPSWTVDEVGASIDAIRGVTRPGEKPPELLDFGLHGHVEHLTYSFNRARAGA